MLGIGNILMGDDGAGPAVARALASLPLPRGAQVIDAGLALQSYVGDISSSNLLIVVDAVESGGPPGTLYSFHLPVPDSEPVARSTHRYDLYSAVAEARSLSGLPSEVVVYGVEPADLSAGRGLSKPVREAVATLVLAVKSAIDGKFSRRRGMQDGTSPGRSQLG